MFIKRISLLLALVLVIGVFTACNGDNGGNSLPADSSAVSSDETSEITAPVDIQFETVVSIGKAYTNTRTAGESYPDTYDSELTDGVYAEGTPTYGNDKLAGFTSGTVRVEIDLGDDGKQLYKFGISFLASRQAGLGPLGSTPVYTSDDCEDWTRAGFLTVPAYEDDTFQIAWLTLETTIDARYVRFDARSTSAWLFVDEFMVIANVQGSAAEQKYLEEIGKAYTESDINNGDIAYTSNGKADRTQRKYSASQGRDYTVSRAADGKYPDTDRMLTDGVETGATYESGNWVGYAGNEALDITVSLGITYKNISDFSISMYGMPSLKILLPLYVDFYISSDNSSFTRIGRVYAPTVAGGGNFTYSLILDGTVTAKFVKFSIAPTECNFYFVEEIDVSYYASPDEYETVYDEVVLPKVTSKNYAKKQSSKQTNLISGLSYQVTAGAELPAKTEGSLNSKEEEGQLTDGKYAATASYTDSAWFRTHGGAIRNIYFDLGYTCAIYSFELNLLRSKSVGIGLPLNVSLYLSDDGKNWYAALNQRVEPKTDASGNELTETAVLCKGELEKPVQARFARFTYTTYSNSHVYIDEARVIGTTSIPSSAIELSKLGTAAENTGNYSAPSKNILGGTEDLLLVYHNTDAFTEEVFLPYVAYLDKEGNIKDTMFDSYLFLPSVGKLTSGGYPYNGETGTNKSDWESLLTSMFKDGYNLDALEKTVAKVASALGKSDYKVKISPTIMYPSEKMKSFGDVDGDGTSEDLSVLEDRAKVIGWYMDEFIRQFEAENFEHLELVGFYWFEEAISSSGLDYKTINAASDLAHERDTQLFWIPYYTARGFAEWSSYGFDIACMQPNYAFHEEVPASRLDDAVDHIKQCGMGIEIEVSGEALVNDLFYAKYMNYLSYGVKHGYMNDSVHMYYQDTTALYKAWAHESPKYRLIYDCTYQFIKGTLSDKPQAPESKSFTAAESTAVSGSLFENADKLCYAKITLSALHGSATVNSDGSFTYYPDKGYKGNDSFSFAINNYLGWSDSVTVNITIE